MERGRGRKLLTTSEIIINQSSIYSLLQHHPEAYFPYFPAGSLVFFLKLYGYFPLFR